MGSEIIVNQILERVHDVNTNGGYFGMPLIAAIEGGYEKVVNMLLRWEIDLNYWSPEHGTDHGADVDVNNGKNGSALAAASKFSSCHPKRGSLSSEQYQIIDLLLQHETTVSITECDLLAASSWKYGDTSQKLIDRFLSYDESAQVTEEVIVKFIEIQTRDPDVRVLQKLLDRHKDLGTTPAMLKATNLSDDDRYADFFKLLLTPDTKVSVSDAALIAASKNTRSFGGSESALELLLKYDWGKLITDEVLNAVVDPKTLALLLGRRQSSQNISAEILEKAASRGYRGGELVSLFLKHDKTLKVTPTVVSAAVTSSDQAYCLNALFEHNSLFQLSEDDMVTLIASYVSSSNSDDLHKPDTERVGSRKDIVVKREAKVIDDAKQEAVRVKNGSDQNSSYRSHHTDDGARSSVSKEVKFNKQSLNRPRSSPRREGVVNLLLRYGQTIEFTPRIRKALDERFPYESEKRMKEKFYRLKRKDGTHAD